LNRKGKSTILLYIYNQVEDKFVVIPVEKEEDTADVSLLHCWTATAAAAAAGGGGGIIVVVVGCPL
jgi:hypothetical protein